MINLKDDGSIEIDFPEPTGLVTVRPPRWGAYKRIRRERQRLADAMTDALAAKPDLEALPDPDDRGEEAQAKRRELGPLYTARLRENEETVADTLIATWRFILLGNRSPNGDSETAGDFDGLAAPRPPEDPDDWPTALFVDSGDISRVGGVAIRTNPTLLDQVVEHWGKVRSRSGQPAGA